MTAHNGFDVRRRRCREIEALARYLGAADTDDFDRFLVAWLHARPAPGDRVFAVQNAAIRMGGRINDAKARALVEEARTTPRPEKPDGWATALCLTYKQRQALGITTIGAIDVRQHQREELRKQRRRQAEERRRRARGAKPQSRSLSRTKPWKAAGMSRASWYRQRRSKPQGPSTAQETGKPSLRSPTPSHSAAVPTDRCRYPVTLRQIPRQPSRSPSARTSPPHTTLDQINTDTEPDPTSPETFVRQFSVQQ